MVLISIETVVRFLNSNHRLSGSLSFSSETMREYAQFICLCMLLWWWWVYLYLKWLQREIQLKLLLQFPLPVAPGLETNGQTNAGRPKKRLQQYFHSPPQLVMYIKFFSPFSFFVSPFWQYLLSLERKDIGRARFCHFHSYNPRRHPVL